MRRLAVFHVTTANTACRLPASCTCCCDCRCRAYYGKQLQQLSMHKQLKDNSEVRRAEHRV
jgi:hypothetical protein